MDHQGSLDDAFWKQTLQMGEQSSKRTRSFPTFPELASSDLGFKPIQPESRAYSLSHTASLPHAGSKMFDVVSRLSVSLGLCTPASSSQLTAPVQVPPGPLSSSVSPHLLLAWTTGKQNEKIEGKTEVL